MQKEFVPYELALKLKELKFKFYPLGYYSLLEYNKIIESKFYASDDYLEAPLWQQAFEWCLDKLKLIESYAIIIYSDSYSLVIMDYYCNDIKENLTQSSTKIECLEKLIEIVSENLHNKK